MHAVGLVPRWRCPFCPLPRYRLRTVLSTVQYSTVVSALYYDPGELHSTINTTPIPWSRQGILRIQCTVQCVRVRAAMSYLGAALRRMCVCLTIWLAYEACVVYAPAGQSHAVVGAKLAYSRERWRMHLHRIADRPTKLQFDPLSR